MSNRRSNKVDTSNLTAQQCCDMAVQVATIQMNGPKASAIYRAGLKKDPNHVDLLYHYALSQIGTDDIEAEKLLRRLLSVNSTHVMALGQLALLMENRNRREAQQLYEKAYKLDKTSPVRLRNYALFLEQINEHVSACKVWEEVIALEPNEANHVASYGDCCQEMQNTPKAMELYRRAIKLNPTESVAVNGLASIVYFEAKKRRDPFVLNELIAIFQKIPNPDQTTQLNHAQFLKLQKELSVGQSVFRSANNTATGIAPATSGSSTSANATSGKHSAEDGCAYCHKSGDLLSCSRCKQVKYCSMECQKIHWKKHKEHCNTAPAQPAQPTTNTQPSTTTASPKSTTNPTAPKPAPSPSPPVAAVTAVPTTVPSAPHYGMWGCPDCGTPCECLQPLHTRECGHFMNTLRRKGPDCPGTTPCQWLYCCQSIVYDSYCTGTGDVTFPTIIYTDKLS